jgi:hypothetical protein
MRELQANTEELNALLADPDFNQNLALNRGQLISLVGSTTRQMLSDPEDMADALRAVNGGGLLGSIVGLVSGSMAAEDFNFTKEDYGRLAEASYVYQRKKYEATVAPIARDAAELEAAAGQLDVFPPGYSLSRYVLSDPEEFENPLERNYPEPVPAVPTLGTAASGVTRLLESFTASETPQAPPANDPAIQSLPDVNAALYAPGTPKALSGLFGRLTSQPAGTTFRMDPKTGRVFAYSQDGQRRELDTTGGITGSGGERGALLEWMRARTGN